MHPVLRASGLAVAGAVLVTSCAATTMSHSWTAPNFDKTTVKKVLVFGVSPNPGLRRTYEDSFSVALEKLGYQAVSGYLWAPESTNLDREAILARMRTEHVTHVLVTRLVNTKDVQTYHAPTTVGVGYAGYGPGYYGSWSSYYSVGYTTVMDPGYTTVNTVVTLETNFYDAAREKDALVWSGTSDTWTDQAQSGSKIDSVISTLVEEMRRKHVL